MSLFIVTCLQNVWDKLSLFVAWRYFKFYTDSLFYYQDWKKIKEKVLRLSGPFMKI